MFDNITYSAASFSGGVVMAEKVLGVSLTFSEIMAACSLGVCILSFICNQVFNYLKYRRDSK